jgi:hypothetical protein
LEGDLGPTGPAYCACRIVHPAGRRHLVAYDDEALHTSLREHLLAEHLGGSRVGSPADELAKEILAGRAYRFEYVAVPRDDELVLDPY